MHDLLTFRLPYFRLGSRIVKVDRTYMYRVGPSHLILAFGPYLNDPYMNYVYNVSLFDSQQNVKDSIRKDTKHLDDLLKNSADKRAIDKLSEMIIAEKALLNDINMRYPVMVIGLKKGSTRDVVEHFETIAYEHLKL